MPASRRDTSKKREAILAAAAEVFIQEGYDRASMDSIAEVAGASKRTVYNHFPSKEVLFGAVLHRFMADSQALKRVAYDPKLGLRSQLDRFVFAMRQPTRDPIWLGLMKVVSSTPALVEQVIARLDQEEDTLVAWLHAAHEDGRVRVPDPELAAKVFWGMCSGAFLMPAIFASPVPEDEAEALQQEMVAMFLLRYATGSRRR